MSYGLTMCRSPAWISRRLTDLVT